MVASRVSDEKQDSVKQVLGVQPSFTWQVSHKIAAVN